MDQHSILDPKTLVFISGVFRLSAGLVVFGFQETGAGHRLGRERIVRLLWGAGNMCIGVGTIFMALRYAIPEILSVNIANTTILAGATLTSLSYAIYSDRRKLYLPAVMIGVLAALLYNIIAISDINDAVKFRSATTLVALIFFEFFVAATLAISHRSPSRVMVLIIIGHVSLAFPMIARLFELQFPASTPIFSDALGVISLFLGSSVFSFLITPAFLLMLKEDSDRENVEKERLLTQRDAEELIRREMQAELLNAEHHQRVTRLATGLAHDFNNLLSLIKFGFQQIQETIPEKNGTNLDQFRMIFPAIEQGIITTKCLMSLGSDRINRPERVNLRAALQDVYDLTAPRLVDRLEYVIACDPDMVVETDRSLLVMALLNVVLNARDAMPYGGQLTVSARALNGTGKEQIFIGELDNTAYVEIKVKDTGYGIPQEDIKAIFEPGVSKSRYRDGAGLGLFMVKQFILRTKSGLNVVSTPDAGTEVCFYIKAANTPEPTPTGSPKTLLVKG